MSIRIRLVLSYIGMIFIPILLFILFQSMLTTLVIDDDMNYFQKVNPVKLMQKSFYKSDKILRQVNIDYLEDKSRLLNPSYIQSLDEGLEEIFSGIITKKDGKIIYISDIVNEERILNDLPKYKEDRALSIDTIKEKGYVLMAQRDYNVDDSKVSMFIVGNIDTANNTLRKARYLFCTIVILAILIVAYILTLSMYRGIIKPIEKLKYATKEIKKGNLNFDIEKYPNDEIGELINDFENMRMELKNAKEIQKKYEENRKTLISNISHDLKTPIMSIKGYVEGIRDGVANSPERMDKYVNTIYDKAKHMENLIDELFLFSKLDLNKVDFDFQNIDIIEYLKYCVEDLSFDIEKKGGEIEFNSSKENYIVSADLQKLKRVILNIIQNAIKYKKEEQLKVRINVRDDAEFVVIEMKDNGKGIPKKDIQYIFDRFYRGDQSRNVSIGGSGLGLAISSEIIKAHGGSIWVESKENIGTSIFFSLKKSNRKEGFYEKNIDH
ncbi:HAMP domain-containing histidine kinase [Lutibacter sp. B2]|nr:HAMP domain-containing histidine kinase [Lutibacter sp. B2]